MKRYSDCEITEYKIREALREANDGELVDAAFAEILRGDFDGPAQHEVLQRRAGSDEQYRELKDAREVALRVVRACGALETSKEEK